MNVFNFSIQDYQQGVFWALSYGIWFGMLIALIRWFLFSGLKR